MKITLTKAISYQDKELKQLDINLEDLTGQDLLDVEEQLKRKNITVNAWEYSRVFLLAVAAHAARVPMEAMKTMNVKDFTAVINEVLSFLAGAVSEDATEKVSGE